LKLNGAHQLLAYADDVTLLGESVYTTKENAEALIVASKEIELEVHADKTKYWLCLEGRMQDKFTVSRRIIHPLKGWNVPNIWENP
jgi:mannose-6-phosphate isomerase-like protein (cupin superfamily)